jgi:hypothetical protein
MSLCRWFSSSSNKPFLPDPAQEKTKEKELEVTNANTRVLEALESQLRRPEVPTHTTRLNCVLSSRPNPATRQPLRSFLKR